MIQADEFPYFSPAGAVYDSGNYPEALAKALEAVEYDKLRAEQQGLREQGVYRGIGIGSYIHVSGFGPSAILGMLDYYTGGLRGLDGQDRSPRKGDPVHRDDPYGAGHRDHPRPGGC